MSRQALTRRVGLLVANGLPGVLCALFVQPAYVRMYEDFGVPVGWAMRALLHPAAFVLITIVACGVAIGPMKARRAAVLPGAGFVVGWVVLLIAFSPTLGTSIGTRGCSPLD